MPADGLPELRHLQGVWRRTLLVRPDGSRDTTTHVEWLQAHALYVDLRQPPLGADPRAEQGFAGFLERDGDVFTWQRRVDLDPSTGAVDAGRLSWQGDVLVERGVHLPYVERWRRESSGEVLCAGLSLANEHGTQAVLVRVGQRLGWAAGSEESAGPSVSTGHVAADGGVTLQRSTSLAHVGARWRAALVGDELRTRVVLPDGSAHDRSWAVQAREGCVADLPLLIGAPSA